MEGNRISKRVSALHQEPQKKADNDKWQTAAGFILWPFFFTLEGGDGAEALEYRELKGEYDALQKTSISKKCGGELPALQLGNKAESVGK